VFNKFFVNVGANIENNIKSNGFVDTSWDILNKNCRITDTIFITSINEAEIEQYIKRIKDKTSFFEHDLTNYILKKRQIQ